MNSLHFVFHALAATLPSEVPEDPSVPACKGVSQCAETSPSHLLPYIASLIPFPLSHFFLFSLALPHFVEISFPFLKSVVFSAASVPFLILALVISSINFSLYLCYKHPRLSVPSKYNFCSFSKIQFRNSSCSKFLPIYLLKR